MSDSRAEAELRAHLMKTIVVPQVMVPLAANGGAQGLASDEQIKTFLAGLPNDGGAPGTAAAPAAPVQSGQPAPVTAKPIAPADKAKADNFTLDDLVAGYEALRDPTTGLIANKYPTYGDAIKGGVHLTHMAKDALAERDQLRLRITELESKGRTVSETVTPVSAPQPKQALVTSQVTADAAQARYDKVLSDIAENGGVLDVEATKLLSKASRELAEATANAKIEERFAARDTQADADKAAWKVVDSYMNEKHPQAARFSEEVSLFVESDPLVKRAVNALLAQGDRQGAVETAWVSFERAHGAQVAATDRATAEATEANLAAREQVRNEAVKAARRDAGVITGSVGGAGAHENRNATGASAEEIQAATEAMRREGDGPGSAAAIRFRQMVIGPSLGFLKSL